MPNIRIKLDVTKLKKEHFFKGAKGTYVDLTVWENDAPDEYGNTHAVKQSFSKEARDAGEKEPYVGNGKWMGQKAPAKPAPKQAPKPQSDPDLDPDADSVPF